MRQYRLLMPPEEQFNSAKMGTLILLVSLIMLKLYSCAEISTKSNSKTVPLSLSDLCPELLNKIGTYWDNPYASMAFVNRYIYSVFSVTYRLNAHLMNVSIFLTLLMQIMTKRTKTFNELFEIH